MYHLPKELIEYIYEFDNTYKEIFDKVLHSRFEIYKSKKTNNYFIFDLFTGRSFTTDSLVHPTWKTTHHTHKNKYKNNERYVENFKNKMVEYCKLELISESLKYDIYNVRFPFNG